jgi:hypothetical protein
MTWQRFLCAVGLHQLRPKARASSLSCRRCGRTWQLPPLPIKENALAWWKAVPVLMAADMVKRTWRTLWAVVGVALAAVILWPLMIITAPIVGLFSPGRIADWWLDVFSGGE